MKRKISSCSRSSSTDSLSSSSSSSDSSSEDERNIIEKLSKKKLKKIRKKEKKKEKKKAKKLLKKKIKKLKKAKKELKRIDKHCTERPTSTSKIIATEGSSNSSSYEVNLDPNDLEKSKARAPMTKEEWEKQQSVIRRVYDPQTGRNRLVKGDGEIVEECVSRERHIAINKAATRGDGQFFQSTMMSNVKKIP